MDVSVQRKEVIAAICVTFDENDIKKIQELVKKSPCSEQGLFLKTILERAEGGSNKPSTTMWYVTVCGNNHVLSDAVGTIKRKLPNYSNGVLSPGNWFSEREVCVGMWTEYGAKTVQRTLSDCGFECSMVKVSDN